MTPVHEGRFEVYLNGTKVYDRKDAPETDFYPSLKAMGKVKTLLAEAIERQPERAAAH